MKLILFGIFILFSFEVFSQEMDCARFRDGKFMIKDPLLGVYIMERKGAEQIEYREGDNIKMVFKVKWISDCSYTLKLKKTLGQPKDYHPTENMIVTVEIIALKEKSYIQNTSSNMYDMVDQSEMFIVE